MPEADVELVTQPLDMPAVEEPHDIFAATGDGPLIRRRYVRHSWGWPHYLMLLLFVGALVGGVVVGSRYLPSLKGNLGETQQPRQTFVVSIRNAKSAEERAFKVLVPEDTWDADVELQRGLTAQVALRHRKEASWIAGAAKDYGMQKPRDAELLNQGIEKLKLLFPDSLELDDKAVAATIAGQPAQRLVFKGQLKAVPFMGECFTLSQNGIGYWFFVAAPTLDESRQTLAGLQEAGNGFVLATDRRGWREQPPKMDTFAGTKIPGTISAPDGIWEKYPALDEDDQSGDVYLLGRYLKEKDNRKNASVLTLALPRQDSLKDAMKFAHKYIEDKKKEENKLYKIVPASEQEGSLEGQKADVGNRPGRVAELKIALGEEPKRYLLLAVINEPTQCIALRCECTWESRQIWRQEFLDLLTTVKVRKKEE